MAFGRRRVAVSVVVVLSILLAISLDSNIRSKVTRGKMMLATDAEVRVENDAEVANVMEASAGEVASVNPGSVVSEAPFTADTGDTGDTADTGEPGVVATSPTAAAIVEPSPGNAASSSSSDAFCRCSQTGGNKPPHGLESFAEEELKKLLEEMRQELRIYIYSVDFHCDKRRPKGTNRGYMVEWNFYDRARSSSMRVLDPERATIFYIPTFTSCWRSQGTTRREGGESAGKRIQQMLKDVTKLPFLQRSAVNILEMIFETLQLDADTLVRMHLLERLDSELERSKTLLLEHSKGLLSSDLAELRIQKSEKKAILDKIARKNTTFTREIATLRQRLRDFPEGNASCVDRILKSASESSRLQEFGRHSQACMLTILEQKLNSVFSFPLGKKPETEAQATKPQSRAENSFLKERVGRLEEQVDMLADKIAAVQRQRAVLLATKEKLEQDLDDLRAPSSSMSQRTNLSRSSRYGG